MIRIGILGDIGSGKSYVAKNFGYPLFNADREVGKIYQSNKKIFNKLKKSLPKYISSFPIDKKEVSHAILSNKKNLNKIVNFMEVDKKNYDKKINLILLRKIGLTTKPGQYRLSPEEMKKVLKKII